MQPIIKEIIADNKTAEAAMSFTFFIVRLKSGHTKSHSFSIAEFIISKLKTIAKQIKIRTHSVAFNLKKIPVITIKMAMTYCILKFFS